MPSAVETQGLDTLLHELEHEVCYATDVVDTAVGDFFHTFSAPLVVSKAYGAYSLVICIMFRMLLQLQVSFRRAERLNYRLSEIFSCESFCALVL